MMACIRQFERQGYARRTGAHDRDFRLQDGLGR
jgi:hypothetical protein